MKSSPSSWLWVLMLLGLVFLASSATHLGQFSNPTTTHHHHPHHRRHRSCSSAVSSSTEQAPSSLCIQIQRIRGRRPLLLPPPPPSSPDEIDPRYGVEKRLVPSGPNPLHNWIITTWQYPSSLACFQFLACLPWSTLCSWKATHNTWKKIYSFGMENWLQPMSFLLLFLI